MSLIGDTTHFHKFSHPYFLQSFDLILEDCICVCSWRETNKWDRRGAKGWMKKCHLDLERPGDFVIEAVSASWDGIGWVERRKCCELVETRPMSFILWWTSHSYSLLNQAILELKVWSILLLDIGTTSTTPMTGGWLLPLLKARAAGSAAFRGKDGEMELSLK